VRLLRPRQRRPRRRPQAVRNMSREVLLRQRVPEKGLEKGAQGAKLQLSEFSHQSLLRLDF
jgi:hypothetical protein